MNIVSGLCVSKGNVKGIAYIVTDNLTLDLLPANTILVMKNLERNILINLSKNIIGVIAENGNIGSHGAGILRQLGIPCILRVKNATNLLKNNDIVELCGSENCIICSKINDKLNINYKEVENTNFTYFSISKENFNMKNIRPICEWVKPRPGRVYQRLRYDIICDVYASSSSYLYKLPHAKTRQDSFGVLETYGTAYPPDICSFVLCHPDWLVDKAKERSKEFDILKKSLKNLLQYTNSSSIEDVVFVFRESIELYKSIFKYLYLAQVTSDEFIDIYLDFINIVTGKEVSKDIFNLHSDYVERCLNSGIDPGGFQGWTTSIKQPYIWNGCIDYNPFPVDEDIISGIRSSKYNKEHLLRDYHAFRTIVPLIYQLSEEFFYISRSINTFINWSIINIYKIISSKNGFNISIHDFYNMSLINIYEFINRLEGGIKGMKYEFMSAFNPEKTLVKEFKYWLILVRENQLTLGDCYFVLKRQIPTFSEMNYEEGAELSQVMKWYENRCRSLYGAEKFNYIAAMMRDNFVHFHAFPRYSKPVKRFGLEWVDERWPGLVRFGPSVCDSKYYELIKNDLSE